LVNYAQEKVRTAERRAALNRFAVRFLPPPLPLSGNSGELLTTLQRQGNVVLPPLAATPELENLRAALAAQPCYDPWNSELGDFPFADTPPQTNNARIRNISEIKEVRLLANHPLVLEVASNYLGCKPTIDDVLAWWSVPGRPAPKEEQFFHRDNDAIRFVKLFVYLGDVVASDGAHVFVTGSHRENEFLERRRRYSDDEIATVYASDRLRPMVGPFGTAFLEDTFGLHKGTVPTLHPRLLFQVRYTSYPGVFARAAQVHDTRGPFDPYINRLIA
jgi:hypothetical protein